MEESKRTHQFSFTLSFAPKRSSDRTYMYVYIYIYIHIYIYTYIYTYMNLDFSYAYFLRSILNEKVI